jgi:hypothetical protein
MKKLKYIKLYENFGKLNESVNENWVVKPYEFKIVPQLSVISNKTPPQAEVDEFESYLDSQVDERSSYGSEDTFENIIENLLKVIKSQEEEIKELKKEDYINSKRRAWHH